MWFIFLSICTASLKCIGADEPQVLQSAAAAKNLQYAPSLNSPLPYSPPSNYAPTNFGEKGLKVPPTQNEIKQQYVAPQPSPTNCPQLETLETILVLLKRILNQNDNTYFTQPDKRIQILQYLKEFLEMSGSRVSEIENHEKLHKLIQRAYKSLLVDNNTSLKTVTDTNDKNHVEANFIFKYNVPNISNIDCKEALATLVQTVKEAHLQLIKYCEQTGKCSLNSETNPLDQHYDGKSNSLQNSLGQAISNEAKITGLNPNLLNSYGIQKTVNNLVNSNNNQILSETDINDNNFNHRARQNVNLNGNQFLNTNNINSDLVNTLNKLEKKNVEAFNNIYSNTKTVEANKLHSDQSNALNGFPGFNDPLLTQAQITPVDPNLLNVHNIQNPLNNFIVMPHTQGDMTQRLPYFYFNLLEQPQPYLSQNNLLTNNVLDAGFVKTENKQEKNTDFSSNKRLNILNDNYLTSFLNTPTSGNRYFQTYNPITLQNPDVKRYLTTNDNQLNQQLYAQSQNVNNNRQSLAFNKQKKLEQIRHNTASILNPNYNPNYWPYIKPNELKTFGSPDLTLTNPQVNLGKFENQNMGLISSSLGSSLKAEQNPYLSSINQNRQNSLNYNSQKADASVQSNYGLNSFTSSNLADYPKHDIYGNTLVDSQRITSASNLVKLNSDDNEGIVELTYKLKRPQSINYNPYYYVKFKMPYRDFISKVNELTKNQNVRSDPLKFNQELLSVSKLEEASSDLNSIQQDELSKFILNHGATLVNAQVLGSTNDTKANEYLKIIQNLNAKLNTNEILNLVETDNLFSQPILLGSDVAFNQPLSLGSDIPAFNQPTSLGPDIPSSVHTLQQQFDPDLRQRRLIPGLTVPASALENNHLKSLPITFLPASSPMLFNPSIPQTFYATLN